MLTKTDIILRWYRDVWINGKVDEIDHIYRPMPDEECLIQSATASVAETKELISIFNNLVCEQKIKVIHTVEQGDWVSAMVEVTGLKIGTDIPFDMRWITMARVDGDFIVEIYPSVNFLTLFEQLKQLPENSFELLLGGTVLR